MKQLKTFILACTLIVCLSGVVFADGGVTQGPGIAPPPDCTETVCQPDQAAENTPDPADTSSDVVDALISWLEKAIL